MNTENSTTIEELLLEMYDFSSYSDEEKNSFVSDTASMITEASLLRSLESAGEETQELFNQFMETDPTDEHITDFIKQSLPEFDTYLREEFDLFNTMNSLEDTKNAE